MASNPTMEDIAREAGVAKITVSRALSGHPDVNANTRKRVQDAADRLGYRLNVAARNLRQQKARAIAVVIEMTPSHERSMSEPCPLSLLGGIMQELTSARHNLVLTTLELFCESPPLVDGVIMIGQGRNDNAEAEIERTRLPYVVWGAQHGVNSAPVVGSDNLKGGRLAAEHFVRKARRKIVFLGDEQHREVADRLRGFRERMGEAGDYRLRVIPCEFSAHAGEQATLGLLDSGDEFNGLFAASDSIALGALAAMKARGIAVPEAVSIVGFDDAPAASHSAPPLTSIRQDWETGGALLARKLLALVEGEEVSSTILDVELSERAS